MMINSTDQQLSPLERDCYHKLSIFDEYLLGGYYSAYIRKRNTYEQNGEVCTIPEWFESYESFRAIHPPERRAHFLELWNEFHSVHKSIYRQDNNYALMKCRYVTNFFKSLNRKGIDFLECVVHEQHPSAEYREIYFKYSPFGDPQTIIARHPSWLESIDRFPKSEAEFNISAIFHTRAIMILGLIAFSSHSAVRESIGKILTNSLQTLDSNRHSYHVTEEALQLTNLYSNVDVMSRLWSCFDPEIDYSPKYGIENLK